MIINIQEFSKNHIECIIKKLKPKTSTGPDNVPPYIVKAFHHEFIEPLIHIFNVILKTGIYPDLWKKSRVSPIPKTGDKNKVENYRPIAVLSSFAKIFESALHEVMYKQLEPYFNDAQHAFRKRRSVNTNLLNLVDFISKKLDERSQVDVIYLDFQKAFDQVDNDVLLTKLSAIGCAPKLLQLFSSYLRDRSQVVRLGCFESTHYHTRSGISQGSSLGPLLFSIMINDLPQCLSQAKCLLYADDLKIFMEINTQEDCLLLQKEIDSVLAWCSNNNLNLNSSKCQKMTFTRSYSPFVAQYLINGTEIASHQTVKDLGIVFDPQLTFHDHILALATDCFRRLGFITRNCRDFSNKHTITLLYTALVRSKLEASACIWNPHESSYTLMLEKVQKRFLRFLYQKLYGRYPFMFPTRFLQGTLGFNSLETRRLNEQLLTVVRLMRGSSDNPELVTEATRLSVPEHRARFRNWSVPLLAPTPARTVARQQSPIFRAQRHFNRLTVAAPQLDLFAGEWKEIERMCLSYAESSTVIKWMKGDEC